MRAVPPRLHVLLARDAPVGVLIRRGPSRHVAVIGWDRTTDRFHIGQWLHGRIYERRSDLSPDGKHLLYFAMNGRWDSKARGAWTALSRAPYLKALTLLAKGDCWHGGGLFLSSKEYWLNDGSGHEFIHDESGLERSPRHPWHGAYGGECPGVYYLRLERDGWEMMAARPDDYRGKVTRFQKRVNADWWLEKVAHATTDHAAGRGCYFDEHKLWNNRTGSSLDFPRWEWVDVDGERLVWTEGGKLFAGRLGSRGVQRVQTLYDSNPLRFEKLTAPY